MRVGIDCDGVLCDFNAAFIRCIVNVTGRDLFPPNYEPTTWNYPESVGYTSEEVDETWRTIKADRVFWYCLSAYPDTENAMGYLADRISHHHDDVYFITARPGVDAKKQTEQWLIKEFGKITSWHVVPTVLITPHKGLAVQTLNLDVYIDDRDRNCLEASSAHWHGSVPKCRTFVMDRPWNRELLDPRIERVSSVVGICEPPVEKIVATSCLNIDGGRLEGTPHVD